MNNKPIQKFALFAVVLGLLSGCGIVTFQTYELPDDKMIPLGQGVSLYAFMRCPTKGITIPAGMVWEEEYCEFSTRLIGPHAKNFGFTSANFVLRNASKPEVVYEYAEEDWTRIDRLYSDTHSQIMVIIRLYTVDPMPEEVELILPEVIVDGATYEVPVIRLKYRSETEFQHALEQGG